MYTYGEPVRANISAKFCVDWRGQRGGRKHIIPCVDVTATDVVGCHPFSIDVDLRLISDRSLYSANLSVDATATELATGLKQLQINNLSIPMNECTSKLY